MSTLKTNAITTVSGKPLLNSTGGILQVVQGVRSAPLTTSGFVYVPAITANITPSSFSSRILIIAEAKVGAQSDYGCLLRLSRGGTPIYLGDVAGTRPRCSAWYTTYSNASTTSGYNMTTATMVYLDSPATTSTITFTLEMSSYSGSVAHMNRTVQWQDGGALGYDGAPASSITLLEVS